MNQKPIYLVVRWNPTNDGTIYELDQAYTDENDARKRVDALNARELCFGFGRDWGYLKIKLQEK